MFGSNSFNYLFIVSFRYALHTHVRTHYTEIRIAARTKTVRLNSLKIFFLKIHMKTKQKFCQFQLFYVLIFFLKSQLIDSESAT